MRPRSLLVLFLVVVGLLAFIWFFERDLPSSDERAELAKKLLSVDADAVSEVAIERDGVTVRLVRSPAATDQESAADEPPATPRWRIETPIAARADASDIESLIDRLAGLEKTRTLEDADEAALGLKPPRATVTLTTADGAETLEIGSAIPASSDMVVRRGGAEAYVIASGVWDDLAIEPGEWRSREVFAAGREEIVSVRLMGAAGEVLLRRGDGDDFLIEKPIEDVADGEAVASLLTALTGLEVDGFLDDGATDPSALGLDPALGVVEVGLGGDYVLRLEIGAASEDEGDLRFARFEGQLAEIGDDLDEALATTVSDWQSKAWTRFEVWQVENFTAVDAGGEVAVVRDGGDWKRGEESIPYSPVSDFLYALTGAAADDLEPLVAAAAAAEEPLLRLTLHGEDRQEELRLYPATEAGHRATVAGRDYALMLPAATVDDLLVKLDEVRSAAPEGGDGATPEETG